MSKAKWRKTPSVPPTATTKKKQKKPKEKQPEFKKAYEMTDAKIDAVVDAKVKTHFAPNPPMNKDPSLDKVNFELSLEVWRKRQRNHRYLTMTAQ